MTDMDWADEVTKQLNIVCGGIEKLCNVDIAIQLRKAKAQGMRDACDEFEACGGYQVPDLMAAMRKQADEIEHPPTT